MKKLMIAAAAAAMVGGVYAGEQCVACGYDSISTDKNPAFFDVVIKAKTLASKKVNCGGCEGWCMEQTSRTINGIIWTCEVCDDDSYPYQIALWEKSGIGQITEDLKYGAFGGTKYYAGTAVYTIAAYDVPGTGNAANEAAARDAVERLAVNTYGATSDDVTLDWDPATSNYIYTIAVPEKKDLKVTTDATYASEKAAMDAAFTAAKAAGATTISSTSAAVGKTDATECIWVTEDWAKDWFRYSKKGDKVEVLWTLDADDLAVTAAGFGTWDAKKQTAKSISGYAVGTIAPKADCETGNLLEVCDDFDCGSTCWDDTGVAAEMDNVFYTATWTMKYNANLQKKTMLTIFPSYYNYEIDATCVNK